MSNISSNALFHFTSNAEYLIGILSNSFIPRYCYEEVTLNDLNSGFVSGALPMVCFCDISLGQISNHLKTYGSYGIGMSKEWGIKNKLNPLVYINENSILADSLSTLAGQLIDDKSNRKVIDEFLSILNFLKPYKGSFERSGKTIENVKFYNEREWRYIPNLSNEKNIKDYLEKEDYKNPVKLAQANNKLKKFKLEFKPEDIKYIFINDEDEIHSMIEALREIGNKFDSKTIDILTSKILTTKQLEEDF